MQDQKYKVLSSQESPPIELFSWSQVVAHVALLVLFMCASNFLAQSPWSDQEEIENFQETLEKYLATAKTAQICTNSMTIDSNTKIVELKVNNPVESEVVLILSENYELFPIKIVFLR